MSRYNVYLWNGSGYHLAEFKEIEASGEEEALELAIVQAEQRNRMDLFFDDSDELHELEESGEVIYIDATLNGAKKPHYIDTTNLKIEELN